MSRSITLYLFYAPQRGKHIILPCVLIELSPLNQFFSIIVAYPGHILGSTKGIEIKLGIYIDVDEKKCRVHAL